MESTGLGDRLEAFVTELVSEGRYKDRSAVLRQSVLLLEDRERKLRALDEAISRGLADVAAGRTFSIEEVRARLDARFSRPAVPAEG